MKKTFELMLNQAVLFSSWEKELQYEITNSSEFVWMPDATEDGLNKLDFSLFIHITYDDCCYLSMYHPLGEELAKTKPVSIDSISVTDVIGFVKSRNWHTLVEPQEQE